MVKHGFQVNKHLHLIVPSQMTLLGPSVDAGEIIYMIFFVHNSTSTTVPHVLQ